MTRCLDGGTLLKRSKPLKRSLIFLFIAAALFITGCGVTVGNDNWPGITASGDVVYVAYGTTVIAVDMVEEKLIWTMPEEPQPNRTFFASPSVVENEIVVGDYGQKGGMLSPGIKVSVFGLEQNDEPTPAVVWTSAESLLKDRIIAPPLQVGDQVFVGTADNNILALDAANGGAMEWEYETGHSIWGKPTYDNGILYVTSLDKSLYTFDAETGDLLWTVATEGSISDKAVLNGDLVYVSSFDHKVHAFDKSSGAVRWTADSIAAIWGAPAYEDGLVFYMDLDGNIYAVDAQSGQPVWSESYNNYAVAAPIVKDGVVYIALAGDLETDSDTRGGSLVALDAKTGDKIWQEFAPAPIYSTPVFLNDDIVAAYINQNTLNLTLYDTEDGDDIWTYTPPAAS
jgi:outer membrane protein assembly factor BamB